MTNWLCTLLPSPMTSSAAGWQGPDFLSCPTNYKASWPVPSCQALVCYQFFLCCLSTCCVTHCSVTKIALKKKKKKLTSHDFYLNMWFLLCRTQLTKSKIIDTIHETSKNRALLWGNSKRSLCLQLCSRC